MLVLLKKEFVAQFVCLVARIVKDGRWVHFILHHLSGELHLHFLHIDMTLPVAAHDALFAQLSAATKLDGRGFALIAGDFNFLPSGERRIHFDGRQPKAEDDRLAARWDSHLAHLAEIRQDLPTRLDIPHNRPQVAARLDRWYTSLPSKELLDRRPLAHTSGNLLKTAPLSDHVPVCCSLSLPRLTAPQRDSVPRWVALHPSFSQHLTELLDQFLGDGLAPHRALVIVKECMYAASSRVRSHLVVEKAVTAAENLYLTNKAYRLARADRIPAAIKHVIASPMLLKWLASIAMDASSFFLHPCAQDLLAERIRSMVESEAFSEALDNEKLEDKYNSARTPTPLARKLLAWREAKRSVSMLACAVDTSQLVSPEKSAENLANHLGSVFSGKATDDAAAAQVLEFRPRVVDPVPLPTRQHLENIAFASRSSAPGMDGIDYAAWKTADGRPLDIIYSLFCDSWCHGSPQPKPEIDYASVFPPKKERESGVITPAETRPIALLKTASKLQTAFANSAIAPCADSICGSHQHGFIRGRGGSSAIVGLDAIICAQLCAVAGRSGVFFADLEAAFPSVSWCFLLVAMLKAFGQGGPLAFVTNLYVPARVAVIAFGGIFAEFLAKSGIRQGCPLSGTLFVICIEGFLRLLVHRFNSRCLLFAFADDMAIFLKELMVSLPQLRAGFLLLERAASLKLNLKKCALLPLFAQDMKITARQVSAIVPGWKPVKIVGAYLYLGVWLGSLAHLFEWKVQFEAIKKRSRFLATLGLGWGLSCALYRMLVSSLVPYVGQFRMLPNTAGNEECFAQSRVLRQPQGGIPLLALAHLHFQRHRVGISCFSHLQQAAMVRAFAFLPDKVAIIESLNAEVLSDDASLRSLARPLTSADGLLFKPIILVMAGVLAKMQCSLVNAAIQDKPRDLQSVVQAKLERGCGQGAIDAILEKLVRLSPGSTMLFAARVLQRVVDLDKALNSSVAAVFLRSSCDAWASPARFGSSHPCDFCSAIKGSSMKHFVTCPVATEGASSVLSDTAFAHLGSVSAFLNLENLIVDVPLVGTLHLIAHEVFMSVAKGVQNSSDCRKLDGRMCWNSLSRPQICACHEENPSPGCRSCSARCPARACSSRWP